ncbi:hypothetical protein COCON_G00229570 [Conger conger]|uniref:Uncharacterized protein n=1 Tax=Conger conger TaxID=82655 RepID=A0A9Q1CUZ3_CONCO|nr:hypothetical protein COCON_G00229570 [Conger conger]
METMSWSEGTTSQAFGMQASNSAIQNDLRFQSFIPGGGINGNSNLYVSRTQQTQHSNYHTLHYTRHNGQIAHGNYWNDKATDLNSVRNGDGFSAQRNGSGLYEPASQLTLRNQTLMNGNDSCNVPPGPQSRYVTHHNPFKADAPQTVMPNATNLQMTHAATGGSQHTQQVLQFSRVGCGAPSTGVQGHGNIAASQQIKVIEDYLKGERVNTSRSFYPSVERNPNHQYSQATAVMGQGVTSRGDAPVKAGKRNGLNDAAVCPTGGNTSAEKVQMDRPNVNLGYLLELLTRGQGPVVGSQAGTACPPSGQSRAWAAGSGAFTDATKGTGGGSVSAVTERMNAIQRRSSALVAALSSNANLPYYGVNGNKSGSGNSSSVQNVVEQQPPSYFQSIGVGRNVSNDDANSSYLEKQSYHLSPTGQQLPGAERRCVQEAQYHTQSTNAKAQPFYFPNTTNSGGAVATRHVGPTQTAKPAQNQIPLSNVENGQNGHPHALATGYSCAPTFPNQVKQPYRQSDNQHHRDPPPYPKTQRYFVTVTQERPGTGFTAKNVVFMADNHEPALSEQLQLTLKEKTAKLDSGVTYAEHPGKSDPKDGETHLSTAIARAESVFNVPKPANQQKCPGSSGQRAVAVVPPISQQSSSSTDEEGGIINTDEGLPFKIKNIWSLTEEEYATPQKMSVPHDVGLGDKLKPNVLATSATAADVDSPSPSEQAASLHNTTQAPDLASPSAYNTCILAASEKDIQMPTPLDLQPKPTEVPHQTEDSGLIVNVSETLPRMDVIESGDQNGEPKKNTFDLSSVPVYEWTMHKLRKMVSVLDWKQGHLPQVEMDIEKLHSIFGRSRDPDLSDVSCSDHYMSIMNEVSSICTEDEHALVFSQVRRAVQKEVAENCHVLRHDATYSDSVYKSSWLNLNEQLDDIDKEHGFPLQLSFRPHIQKCEDKEVNESELGNTARVPIKQEAEERQTPPVLTEGELPASSKGVSPTKDPRSSKEINVLPSEEVNESENGHMAEGPIEQEAEKRVVLPLPNLNESVNGNLAEGPSEREAEKTVVSPPRNQTESPASEDGVVGYKDPLSSIEISVLSDEDARRFFNEITDEAEDLRSEAPEPRSEEKGRQTEAELPEPPVKEKEKSQMEIYCCLAQWLYVMSGYGNKSVCSCQSKDAPNQESMTLGASTNDIAVPAANSLSGGPSTTVGTAHSVHNTGCGERNGNEGGSNECTTIEHKSMDRAEKDSLHGSNGRSSGPPSEQKAEIRMSEHTPSDSSGAGNHADPETPPTTDSSGSNIVEVQIQDVYSSHSDICQIASAKPVPPHAEVDVVDASCGSTETRNLSLGCNKVVAKCGTFGQQARSPAAKGIKRMQVLASNSNHKDKNIKRETKSRKRKWEISNHSVSDHEKWNKKPCPQTTVEESKSRTYFPEKREGDDRSETLRPKVPKGGKIKHPRSVPANNSERGKMPGNSKVLLVLSKQQDKARSVSLALYGSSPQKKNGTSVSHRLMDRKSSKVKSKSIWTMPPPPKTISFNLPPNFCPPVKSLAKQQVFAKWKSSLVIAEDDHQAKPQRSKRKAKNGGKTPTAYPNHPKPPTDETSASSSQPVVTPLKLRAVTADLKKTKNRKSTENELADRNSSNGTSAKRDAAKERQRNLSGGPFLKLNKIEVETTKPKKLERRRSTVPVTQMKSKYELGSPALVPLQRQDRMLEFKLLPESFSFKDGEDQESLKPKDMKETGTANIVGRQSASLKTTTWKDSWSKSSKGKEPTSPEVMSPGATKQMGTTFQEYRKKYMAKGKN